MDPPPPHVGPLLGSGGAADMLAIPRFEGEQGDSECGIARPPPHKALWTTFATRSPVASRVPLSSSWKDERVVDEVLGWQNEHHLHGLNTAATDHRSRRSEMRLRGSTPPNADANNDRWPVPGFVDTILS
jgi:hypothetical protein